MSIIFMIAIWFAVSIIFSMGLGLFMSLTTPSQIELDDAQYFADKTTRKFDNIHIA